MKKAPIPLQAALAIAALEPERSAASFVPQIEPSEELPIPTTPRKSNTSKCRQPFVKRHDNGLNPRLT